MTSCQQLGHGRKREPMDNNKYFKTLFFIFVIVVNGLNLFAQEEVNITSYDIVAKLDTADHKLFATSIIKYVNNSGTEIDRIYIHLWANALASNDSEFVTQQLRLGMSDAYFLKDHERGGYETLEVKTIGGQSISTRFEEGSKEIMILDLNDPLLPGDTYSFEIDYVLKIPKLVTRFGYKDRYYQMTHWYPKVAKCENGLWHAMPYLTLGEYYHDFANYHIAIDVPKGFTLASTGTQSLQGGQIKCTAHGVTDFAWFVSDSFDKETEKIIIDGRPVSCHVYKNGDHESWDDALKQLKRSVEFFSDQVGPYPYPQASVVLSGLGNSGMEYPMIANIGVRDNKEHLDHLIAHEVGHNWFYAILATNERRYPWMDEGLTSFYDHKYHLLHYGHDPYESNPPHFTRKGNALSILQSSIIERFRQNRLKSSSLHSNDYSLLDYGISLYERPANGFKFLESYLGEDVFSNCIRAYYNNYQFDHPSPIDLQNTFEEVSKQDLSWFFEDFIQGASGPDFSLENLDDHNILVINGTGCAAPCCISFENVENKAKDMWTRPFVGIDTIALEGGFNSASLQQDHVSIDINPNNDQPKSLMPQFFTGIDDPTKHQVFWHPYLAYNVHDNLMLGLNLYNSTYPQKRFKWFLTPALSLVSGKAKLSGIAGFQYDLINQSNSFRKLILGAQAKSFNYLSPEKFELSYSKLKPFLRLYLNDGFSDRSLRYFELNSHLISEEHAEFGDGIIIFDHQLRVASQLKYHYQVKDPIAKLDWQTILEFQSYKKLDDNAGSYIKLSSSYSYKYQFAKSKFLKFRIFGAYFLANSERQSASYANQLVRGSIALTSQGYTDQLYDEFYLGRNLQSGFLSRQIHFGEGNFKNALTSAYNLGLSNHFAFAINFEIDTPLKLKPYLDVGYYASKLSEEAEFVNKTLYSIGFAIELIDETLAIYIPLINSQEIKDIYSQQSFLSRISFTMNINKADPWKLVEETY